MDGRKHARRSNYEVTSDLRIGVIGLGFGANHARILRSLPGACLAAVADANPERLAEAVSPEVCTYTSHEAMLASERLDAVIVAVPAGLHAEVALCAIEAGCAVLVEKPLAPSYAEALRIVEAARNAGVSLMPGHIECFNPAVIELSRRLGIGEIGRVLQVTARRMSSMRAGEHGSRLPPTDVNVVHDSAIHDIYAIRYLLGLEVSSVFSASQSGIVTAGEDAISALLHFEGQSGSSAPIASLEVNWLAPRRVRDLTVLGDQGMFVLDYAAPSLTLHKTAAGPAQEISITREDQLEVELGAFVAAVRSGTTMPVTAEDGLAAVAVADALTRSARLGRPVAMEEVLR